jgi:serine/threonine protein phosphatase 1
MLGRFLARKPKLAPPVHALPAGERIYAIGDIHGRADCLDTLIDRIDADDAARGPAQTTLVFLGDLVDRGADSRGVVERAMTLATQRPCRFLMGNHEEVFIKAWEGDTASARLFHRIGGRETLLSYGVSPGDYDKADFETLIGLIGERVPAGHIAFLRRFEDIFRSGDYLFVHAGIRPGTPIDEQDPTEMRWIRERFLHDPRDHGALVVHGHSISAEVEECPNRIGIDTGAYASGRLTALGLEGTGRWFLDT